MSILKSNSTVTLAPQSLWESWPKARFVTTPAPSLRHENLLQYLRELAARYPNDLQLENIGRSFQGRVIQLLKLGVGERHILFWSQMHGDEPSATPALLDIADYLLSHCDSEVVRAILENFTLLMVPMLNPDGAEVYERCNAQGIDINRDAIQLATPEGRLLKQVRDDYEPMLGLNLHDQNRMTTVGSTGRLATTSVLAVSGDAENTLTRARLRTKRACAAIVEALTPFIPGGVARYDESWSPLAFGDNITAWGTPVVLIESGGLPAGSEVTDLTRLVFVALLTVLKDLAEDDLAAYDPQTYESLPENQTDGWSDVVVRGGLIKQPGIEGVFRGDLAFNYLHNGRQAIEASAETRAPSQIFMIGDASCHGAGTSINAHESVLLPAFNVCVKGLSSQQWMGKGNLARLARLGVGIIYWEVSQADRLAAWRYADTCAIRGLPRIEVLTSPSKTSVFKLAGPPKHSKVTTISEVLEALGAESPRESRALDLMWMEPTGAGLNPAALRKDQPASFLMVSTGGGGKIDFLSNRLISVWLDGHRVI
jgi:hypothetical protein